MGFKLYWLNLGPVCGKSWGIALKIILLGSISDVLLVWTFLGRTQYLSENVMTGLEC